jgi:hypothetical protein
MSLVHVLTVLVMLLGVQYEAVADCAATGAAGYVCGVRRAEDAVAVPNTPWIVTSGLSEGSESGALFLIDRARKTATVLFPDEAVRNRHDAHAYPGCPGSVPDQSFSAHGINLRRGPDRVHTLYVINHSAREAVEVFELDVSGGAPMLAWKGCVLLPNGSVGNAVAPLPEGGFAVTLTVVPQYFAEPGAAKNQAAWGAKFIAAEPTGYVVRWAAKQGWTVVRDTEASGPNGAEISADGRWLWVANWADKQVVRVALRDDTPRVIFKMDFMPDNVRWGDDGQLWVAGAAGTPAGYFDCRSRPGCKGEYAIARIDPGALTAVSVPHPPTLPAFGDATTALKIGAELWLAAYPGDRVAYVRLEK